MGIQGGGKETSRQSVAVIFDPKRYVAGLSLMCARHGFNTALSPFSEPKLENDTTYVGRKQRFWACLAVAPPFLSFLSVT